MVERLVNFKERSPEEIEQNQENVQLRQSVSEAPPEHKPEALSADPPRSAIHRHIPRAVTAAKISNLIQLSR
jgi:hypothetical protein